MYLMLAPGITIPPEGLHLDRAQVCAMAMSMADNVLYFAALAAQFENRASVHGLNRQLPLPVTGQ